MSVYRPRTECRSRKSCGAMMYSSSPSWMMTLNQGACEVTEHRRTRPHHVLNWIQFSRFEIRVDSQLVCSVVGFVNHGDLDHHSWFIHHESWHHDKRIKGVCEMKEILWTRQGRILSSNGFEIWDLKSKWDWDSARQLPPVYNYSFV